MVPVERTAIAKTGVAVLSLLLVVWVNGLFSPAFAGRDGVPGRRRGGGSRYTPAAVI